MVTILSKIQDRLELKVTELKHIDEDWGQMAMATPPVKFPCALIDVQQADYTNDGNLTQQAIAVVAVRLYCLKTSGTSSKAPDTHKERYTAHWQLLDKCTKSLHGYILPDSADKNRFGRLIRTRMTKRISNEGGIIQFETLYTLQFTDNTCVPVLETKPRPTIKIVTHKD